MKIHTNKAAIVSLVYDAMLIGLAISLFIGLDLNRYWFIHTTVIVFALLIIYIINKEPVFILEKSDRLVFQYLIRRITATSFLWHVHSLGGRHYMHCQNCHELFGAIALLHTGVNPSVDLCFGNAFLKLQCCR